MERKVRTPHGNARGNSPPSKDEDKWNREKVQDVRKSVAVVKAAKLCVEQDQIGERL